MKPKRAKPSLPAPSKRRQRLRVAAGLLWRGGRLLLLQRHRSEKLFPLAWEFPGGKLEPGETPRRALARELREELSIRARVGPLVAHYRHRYREGLEVELWFFRVTAWRGRLRARHAERLVRIPLSTLSRYRLLQADRRLARLLRTGGHHGRNSPLASGGRVL